MTLARILPLYSVVTLELTTIALLFSVRSLAKIAVF
jgi:hypothetical protein